MPTLATGLRINLCECCCEDLIRAIIKNRSQFEAPDGTYDIAHYLQDHKLSPKQI